MIAFPVNLEELQYYYFLDNTFTEPNLLRYNLLCYNLLCYLREKRYGGTRTVKQIRITQSWPLENNKKGFLYIEMKSVNAFASIASNCVGAKSI